MISSFKRLWRDRRGNALAIAGAALPLVLGSAGLASDTIQWTLWKRQLQRAADSAAMAGVYANRFGQGGRQLHRHCGRRPTRTRSPTTSRRITGSSGSRRPATSPIRPRLADSRRTRDAVRVSLSIQKRLSFSGLFMRARRRSRATSTATIVPSGKYCVISLEEHGRHRHHRHWQHRRRTSAAE